MWGRAVLALLAALAALVLALLMTPVRVRMWFGGEGFRVRATVAVSPWPFLFWVRVYDRAHGGQALAASGESWVERLPKLLRTLKQMALTLSRGAAPGHRVIDLAVDVAIGAGDAAATGLLCGAVHATVWGAVGVLYARAASPRRPPKVSISAAFSDVCFRADVSLTIQLLPMRVLRSQGFLRAALRLARDAA